MSRSIDEILDDFGHTAVNGANRVRSVAEAKQALYDLILSEVVGEDLQVLPTGYMPESHEEVNIRLSLQRQELAELFERGNMSQNNKDAGMYQLDNPDYPKVKIGRFTILKQNDSNIWIQDGDSEGGEFSNELFEKAIELFFNKEY